MRIFSSENTVQGTFYLTCPKTDKPELCDQLVSRDRHTELLKS